MRSIAKSKDLRTYFTLKVYEMRRSFDSLALAQDDILNLMTLVGGDDRFCERLIRTTDGRPYDTPL